jgi:hypothetical protein
MEFVLFYYSPFLVPVFLPPSSPPPLTAIFVHFFFFSSSPFLFLFKPLTCHERKNGFSLLGPHWAFSKQTAAALSADLIRLR